MLEYILKIYTHIDRLYYIYLFIWLLLEMNSFHKRRKTFIRNSNHLHLKSIIYSKHFILCIFLSFFYVFLINEQSKSWEFDRNRAIKMMLKNVLNTQNVTDDLKTKNQLRHVIRERKLKIPKHGTMMHRELKTRVKTSFRRINK